MDMPSDEDVIQLIVHGRLDLYRARPTPEDRHDLHLLLDALAACQALIIAEIAENGRESDRMIDFLHDTMVEYHGDYAAEGV